MAAIITTEDLRQRVHDAAKEIKVGREKFGELLRNPRASRIEWKISLILERVYIDLQDWRQEMKERDR